MILATREYLHHLSVFFVVFIAILSPCSTEHWMCSYITCSTDVIISESNLNHKCVDDSQIMTIDADFMRCIFFCLIKKCVLVASNEGKCVISGVGKLLSNKDVVFQQSTYTGLLRKNVALQQSITCSSFYGPDEAYYHWECDNANDGLTDTWHHMFHSSTDDSNPWLVIDLGDEYSVQKLEFLTRMDFPLTHQRTRGINFYLGSVEVLDGEFSANGYQQIWYYEGPYGDPGTGGTHWLEYTLPIPKCGRYFAMAKDEKYYERPELEVTEIRVLAV